MNTLMKAAALAGTLCFGASFDALAQGAACPGISDVGGDFFATPDAFTLPTSDERHKVEDLISTYAWLMDSQVAGSLAGLFMPDGVYILCLTGQSDVKKRIPVGEIQKHFAESFKALSDGSLRARRMFSNILIRKNKSDQSFEAIISAVIFTQSLTSATSPQIDYMASLYVTIVPETGNTDAPLKFKLLRVISDPKGIIVFAR